MKQVCWGFAALALLWADGASAQVKENPHGRLPNGVDCVACHTPTQWRPLRHDLGFDHDKAAGFALTGKHAAVACAGCHRGLRFALPRSKARDCASCHTDVHQARLGRDCASCHDTQTFASEAAAQAHSRTNFPLSGAHAQVPCEGCHRDDRSGRYTALDMRCVSCHQADYERKHAGSGVSTSCTACHSGTISWTGATFLHEQFALLGAHAAVSCSACHTGANYQLLFPRPAGAADCVACHRPDYDREHAGTGYPTACLSCHNNGSWSDASLRHDAFPLTGAHSSLVCSSCHAPLDYHLLFPKPGGTSDCVACHRADYDRQHSGSGFPTTCMTCHTSNTSWQGASVDHTSVSGGFTLLGAHIRATCGSCHAPPDGRLRFVPPPTGTGDCVACHRSQYDSRHGGSGYPLVCLGCHNNDSWSGAVFQHSQFPLVGAHTTLPCAACHAPDNTLIYPRPNGSSDCVACHQADYDRQHTGSGFPTACTNCHTTSTFTGAVFDHAAAANGFVLQGIHAQIACSSCHAPDGQPLFRPAGAGDCVTCHQADYTVAHSNTGFPTTCALCHQPTATWASTFDHDAQHFPIYSGSHRDKWSVCQDCHTSPTDFRVFSCLNCHGQQDMNTKHGQVSGYAYESVRCYSCHPRGTH